MCFFVWIISFRIFRRIGSFRSHYILNAKRIIVAQKSIKRSFSIIDSQHMTMFAFFALNSIFELMYHFRVPAMPPQLEYAAAAIAYSVEGLLFLWHLEGRPPMDVQVKIFFFAWHTRNLAIWAIESNHRIKPYHHSTVMSNLIHRLT